ncbi:MAG: CBS domain-containing protein [Nitrospirae bacterium]|nr:CBS domain-containing protein [Nitrospirota bacterium]
MFTKTPEGGLPTILYTVPPDARVGEVASLMAVKGVGAVVVVEDQRPIGILTDRDIVVRVNAQMLDVEKVLVREAMSSPLVTVPKHEDPGVAVALMCRHGIRRLPIVDEQGRLFSIITLDDVLLLHLAGQDDLTGIIRRQLHPDLKAGEPTGTAKDKFADLYPPAFPARPPYEGTVAHIARPSFVLAMERRAPPGWLESARAWFRHKRRWMAIMLALSLLAAAFAMLVVYWGSAFWAYNPQYYEPKDLSRQQYLEQLERDRQKEGP